MSGKILGTSVKMATGATLAYVAFWLTSHPRSNLHQRLPKKKIKNIQLLPHVKIVSREKTYHIHHWLIFSSLYVHLVIRKKIIRSKFKQGLLLGGILQGLSYKDRFRFFDKHDDLSAKQKLLQDYKYPR